MRHVDQEEELLFRVRRRCRRAMDDFAEWRIRHRNDCWPCTARKYLVVGCESSGTTPISHLLLRTGKFRFFVEGDNPWVWNLYQSVYQGHSQVSDYPRLQLYDAIKVPGFAAILPQFREQFPNSIIVFVVRDPRDVVVSAFKTWNLNTREELASIPWVTQTWLGIDESDPVARLAWRWRLYLERSQGDPGVTNVRYEDFCADKPGFIQNLASELGIPINPDVVSARCDRQASSPDARNYHPTGPGSSRQFGLVGKRDRSLLEEICGAQMREWGYD